MLAVGQHDALGRRFENAHDLADAQALREDLRERERRLVLEVRDAAESLGRPGGDRRVAGRRIRRRAPGIGSPCGSSRGWPSDADKRVDLVRRQRVFAALGRGVHVCRSGSRASSAK